MGWFRKAPPQSVAEQVVQSPLSRFNPFRANVYERKTLPGPGAQNYAYENLGLYEQSPIGPAVANRKAIKPLSISAPLFAVFGTYTQGLGGVVQGTLYGQPLSSPPIEEQIT